MPSKIFISKVDYDRKKGQSPFCPESYGGVAHRRCAYSFIQLSLAAKILWALLALGFVGGVVAALLGRMKMKMQLRLERMEKEAIGQLSQEKIRFYINLSHELRTPLTLILSPLQEIREHEIGRAHV